MLGLLTTIDMLNLMGNHICHPCYFIQNLDVEYQRRTHLHLVNFQLLR